MTEEQERLLSDFKKDGELRGRRPRYVIGLKYRIRRFFEYLNENNLSLNRVRIKEAQEFQGWLIERTLMNGAKYANISISCIVFAVVVFYDYLKSIKMVYSNPFKEIQKIRIEKRIPRNILKEKEMNMFLKEMSKFTNVKGLKNQITRYKIHVVSELMYSTGLRISEVANLKVNDIDFDRGIVKVIDGKGGSDRIAFLNDYASRILKLYVEVMRLVIFNEWNKRNDLLFGSKWSWLSRVVNNVLSDLSNEMNIPLMTSHGFRHAVGFHLLRAGCDIRYIQSILGHKRLRTTEVYTKVEKDDLKEVLDKFHPRKFTRKD